MGDANKATLITRVGAASNGTLTMLQRSQARARPEPRVHVGDLVEPVLGDTVKYRDHAAVADSYRLVAQFRVPWDVGRRRDASHHLMRSNQEGWVSEATRPTLSDRGCDEDITKTCY
jgi:hypothetical protein